MPRYQKGKPPGPGGCLLGGRAVQRIILVDGVRVDRQVFRPCGARSPLLAGTHDRDEQSQCAQRKGQPEDTSLHP